MAAEELLTSTANPAVVAAVRLHRARHRREEGRTLIEGPAVVAEAFASGADVAELFGTSDEHRSLAETHGVTYRAVSDHVLSRVADTKTPRGPVAVLQIPPSLVPPTGRLLVAWGIADPGNCGTLVRTAAAFGYGYVSGPGSADPWSTKTLRSAAGGHFRTSVGQIDSLGELTNRQLIGTIVEGGEPAGPIDPNTAIVIGSEAHGLPADVLDGCDRLVSLPMPGGTESLNAAVAGAIVAYLGAIGSGD
jgi:RNA methyltransferase, TrmH family